MGLSLQELILQEIENKNLKVFYSAMFLNLGNYKAVSKALERLVNDKKIRRIARGIYDKPEYNARFEMFASPNINDVANAIASQFNWNICPSGNYALNLLGLSTQIPAKYIYISDGPYKTYMIEGSELEFKHSNKKEISDFSYKTLIVIQALKALGKNNITNTDLEKIKKHLSDEDKQNLLKEGIKTNIWIYEIIKQICGGINV